jgi:ABC-2 type transport system permease protein
MWLVARREFVGRGKSGGYIITTVLMAVVLLGSTVMPSFFTSKANSQPLNVILLDKTGAVAQPLQAAVQAMASQPGARPVNLEINTGDEAALTERVKKENKALLVVEGTFPNDVKARFLSVSTGLLGGANLLLSPLEGIVRTQRLQARGIDPNVMQEVMKPMEAQTLQLTEKGEGQNQNQAMGAMLVALGVCMVVYMVVMLNGQFIFQGVLEEKVSRVIEVMAASVGPGEMLAGKVLGLGGLGLIQFMAMMAAWVAGTLINQRLVDTPASGISVSGALVALAFLVLGYLLSAALNAAAASTISRMEDSQAVAMPLSMLQAVPFMMIIAVMQNPAGPLARVLSLIPFFSQSVMVMRVLMTDVPVWEVATSLGLMAVMTVFMVWAGGRIYRAAMLLYGARPSFRTVLGYLRS